MCSSRKLTLIDQNYKHHLTQDRSCAREGGVFIASCVKPYLQCQHGGEPMPEDEQREVGGLWQCSLKTLSSLESTRRQTEQVDCGRVCCWAPTSASGAWSLLHCTTIGRPNMGFRRSSMSAPLLAVHRSWTAMVYTKTPLVKVRACRAVGASLMKGERLPRDSSKFAVPENRRTSITCWHGKSRPPYTLSASLRLSERVDFFTSMTVSRRQVRY